MIFQGSKSATARKLLLPVNLFALGAVFFLLAFGSHVLSNSWTSWLYSSKRPQYEAAWLAFRHAAWSFPIGTIPSFFYPHGSTVAYMDGAPWYLTALKILSPILPSEFAAWGWWIALCCILQAFGSWFLMSQLTSRCSIRWLGTVILTFSPALIERSVHFALMSHWVILVAWGLFFYREETHGTRWGWVALLAYIAGIHPYLWAMVFAIRIGSLVYSHASMRHRIRDLFVSCAVTGTVFYLFGYLSNGSTKDVGAALFSSDLASFIISMNTSAVWPSLPSRFGEQEGYAYLGLGGMVLALAALFSLLSKKAFVDVEPARSWQFVRSRQALLIASIMLVFSFGPVLRVFGSDLASPAWVTNPLYHLFLVKPFKALPQVFRAPGRFAWPSYYLLLALGMRAVSLRRSIMTAVVLLQVTDFGPEVLHRHNRIQSESLPHLLHDPAMRREIKRAKKIDFLPIEPREVCGLPPDPAALDLLKGVLVIAARNAIPINSGLQARPPIRQIQPLCQLQMDGYRRNHFEEGTVYIVDKSFLVVGRFGNATHLLCQGSGRFEVCMRKHRHTHRGIP